MQLSAEIRWLWQSASPQAFKEWFKDPDRHEHAAGGGTIRIDHYLRDPNQMEIGIKLRGGKKEDWRSEDLWRQGRNVAGLN